MERTPRLTFKRLTGPAAEPVTRSEAKAWARVEIDDDNTIFDALIIRAREYCEAVTKRQFITATYALVMDGFPVCFSTRTYRGHARSEGTDIILPRPPLISVQSIVYLDQDGASQTVAAADYIVSAYDDPGRIALAFNKTWPLTYEQINAVTVSYTAGYGAASAVPESIKMAMWMLIAHWNENREAVLTGAVSKEVEFSVGALLRPYTCTELWQGSLQ